MRISLLSSGSKANCAYVEAGGFHFLIDCGLSHRQVELRMKSIGVRPECLSAIIITHEHADHTRGVASVSRRYQIPVYVNDGAKWSVQGSAAVRPFQTENPFLLGDARVTPFPIPHDAVDPVGFRVEEDGAALAYVTDAGNVTQRMVEMLSDVDLMAIEANHDEEMLWLCGYPWVTKQRIASETGHLSNTAAGEVLSQVITPRLKTAVLCHISDNSNTPDLAAGTVSSFVEGHDVAIVCASVSEPTPVFYSSSTLEASAALVAS